MEFGPKTQKLMEKTGRNLLLFQEIEHRLKSLVSLGALEISTNSGVRPSPHGTQTLGVVANLFLERHLSTEPPAVPETTPVDDEMKIQCSFQIGGDAAEDLAERIRRAIPDRNRLAHTLIRDFALITESGRDEACRWLDASHAEHNTLLDALCSQLSHLRGHFRMLASFWQSKEGVLEMLRPDIQRLPIIELLKSKAELRTDGSAWIPVAEAVRGVSKVEVQKAWANVGLKSLTELMLASGFFEVRAEETARGGTRMVHRVVRSAE